MRDNQPGETSVTAFPSIDALHCPAHTYDYITKPFQIEDMKKVVCAPESRGFAVWERDAKRPAAIRERQTMGLTLARCANNISLLLSPDRLTKLLH